MADLWHRNAKKVVIPHVPDLTFKGGGHKVVWHSTEGRSAAGAVATYGQTRSVPHFTISYEHGKRVLLQHLPINRAATALEHPPGTMETNRANAIQVEIVGIAAESANWDPRLYHYLNLLAQWCERHFEVPLVSIPGVQWRHPKRLSERSFYTGTGHCGHVHVPNNHHTDPGTGFHAGKVLKP